MIRKRWTKVLLAVIFMAVGYQLFQFFLKTFEQIDEKESVRLCDYGQKLRKELILSTGKVHRILDTFKIRHFLCYNSLWGALKRNAPLPWDNKVSLCALNQDLTNLDEVFLKREFLRKTGLILDYDSAEGMYLFRKPSSNQVLLVITLFEPAENNELVRIGWKRRLLPPSSPSLEAFPARLLEPPLSVVELSSLKLPAPREGIEIQKYHYSETWWKDEKPEGC